MTPEELNRTIEFIIESQARLSAAQEHDREERIRFEQWSKGLFTEMAADRHRIVEILEIQSRRLDRAEREDQAAQKRHDAAERRYDAAQKRFEELMREIRAGLDRIFEKLDSRE